MSIIDNRIVSLKFDNEQFQKAAGFTLTTLEQLKKHSDLKGATSGINSLNSAAKDASGMNAFGGAVEGVRSKFSALEVMAITALSNITTSAMNAGKQLASAFTIQPVKDGFAEYELKMQSVQTIMASTGEDIGTVNSYLNELNTYADKTIYSFSDMTASIGKFTNAGVPLKDAVKAIQGISNEAAVSGANANQASHAMYNFAQALSQGSVKLMDWKSIENAQMATVEFKQELIDTAVKMGTLTKQGDMYVSTTKDLQGKTSEAFNSTKMFNESLSSQWMTTDVLVETLGRYADETTDIGKKAFAAAQDVKTFSQLIDTTKEALGSGWATSFEHIFGDKEEAKELWTGVSNSLGKVINDMSNARNEMLKTWKELGGRDDLINAFKALYDTAKQTLTPIKEAFQEIIPPMTGKRLADLTKKFYHFALDAKLSTKDIQNLKDTFRGLFTVLKNVGKFSSKIFTAMLPVMGKFIEVTLSITGAIGRIIAEGGGIGDILSSLVDILSSAIGYVTQFASSLINLSNSFTVFDLIDAAGHKIANFIKSINISNIDPLKEKFKNLAKTLIDGFKQVFTVSNISQAIDKVIKLGIVVGLYNTAKMLKSAFKSLVAPIKDVTEAFNIFKAPIGLLKQVKETFKSWQQELNANILIKIAAAIGILAVSLAVLASLDPARLAASLGAVTAMMGELIGGLKVLDTMELGDFGGAAAEIVAFAVAVGILAGAMKMLSTMDLEELAKGIGALSAIMFGLAAAMKIMGGPQIMNMTRKLTDIRKGLFAFEKYKAASPLKGVIAFAVAVVILCEELQRLGRMSFGQIITALTGLGGAMAILVGTMKYIQKQNIDFGSVKILPLLGFVSSFVILAKAMQMVGGMSFGDVMKGLIAMGAFIGGFSIVSQEAQKVGQNMKPKALQGMLNAMLKFASAFGIFAKAMNVFEDVSWGGAIRGLVSFTVFTAGFIVLMRSLEQLGKMQTAKLVAIMTNLSTTMAAVAGSFFVFAQAIEVFHGLSWSDTLQGLLSFAVMITGLVAALRMLDSVKFSAVNMVALGGSLILVGAAFNLMALALKSLAGIKFTSLLSGLFALTSVLAGFAILAKVLDVGSITKMAGLAGTLIIISAAIMVFAPAMMALSLIPTDGIVHGLLALAGVFAVFGAAAVILAPAIPAMIALAAALGLLGAAFALFGVGMIGIGAGLASIAAAIGAFAALTSAELRLAGANIKAFVGSLMEIIPTVATALAQLIANFITEIASHSGEIVDALLEIAREVIRGWETITPEFLDAGAKVALTLIEGITEHLPEVADKASELIITFGDAIIEHAEELINKGIEVALAIIEGIGRGLTEHQSKITEAISALVEGILSAWGAYVEGLAEGIGKGLGQMLGSILDKAFESLPNIGTSLSEFAKTAAPFLNEMAGIDPEVMEGTKNLAEAIGILAGVQLIESLPIVKLFGGSGTMKSLGKNLSAFASSLSGLDELDPSTVETVNTIAKLISTLTKASQEIPNSGGIAGLIAGNNDLDTFAKKISKSATSLSTIQDLTIDKSVAEKVKTVAELIKTVSEVARDIPNSKGLINLYIGDNDIADFAKKIKKSATALAKINDIEEIDKNLSSKIGRVVDIIKDVSNVAKGLPKTGGLAQLVSGEQDIKPFADMIKQSVIGLAQLKDVEGLDVINEDLTTKIGIVMEAIANVSQLATKMPKKGGIKQFVDGFINGGVDMSSFGEMIVQATTSLSAVNNVSGLNSITPELGEKIGVVLKAISSVVGIANRLPKNDQGAIDITGFDIGPIISMVVDATSKLGGLKDTAKLDNIDDNLISTVEKVCTIVSKISSLSKKLPTATADTIPQESFDITPFVTMVTNATGALATLGGEKKVENIDDDFIKSVEGVIKLISKMSTLAQEIPRSNGLTQAIGTFVEGEMDIGPFISMIQYAMGAFEDMAPMGGKESPITDDFITTIENVINVIKKISEMATSMPKTGGLGEVITGSYDISPFISQVKDAGTTFAEMASDANMANISDDFIGQLQKIIDIIKQVTQMASTLPQVGGIGSIFTGDQSITPFINQIKASITSLAELANSGDMVNFNDDFVAQLDKAVEIIQKLSAAASKLSGGGSGGIGKAISSFISNKIDMASFTGKIKEMLTSLKTLTAGGTGTAIDDSIISKMDKMQQAFNKLKSVVEAAKQVKVDGGAGNTGKNLEKLATNLKTAAPKLATFSDEASKIKITAAAKLKTLMAAVKNASKGAGEGDNLKTLGKNLESLGKNMSKFSNHVANVNADEIKTKMEAISKMKLDGSGFKTFANNVKKSLDSSVKSINKAKKTFKTAGQTLSKNLASGFKKNANQLKTNATNAANQAKNAASQAASGFETAGGNCALGFAHGISSHAYFAEQAARAMVEQAKAAANAAADSHSPSREFMKIGRWSAEGYAIGLKYVKHLASIKKNSAALASAALTAISKTLQVNSPSKLTTKIGEYTGKGLVVGLNSTVRTVAKAAKGLSKALTTPLKEINPPEKTLKSISGLSKNFKGAFNKAKKVFKKNAFETAIVKFNSKLTKSLININKHVRKYIGTVLPKTFNKALNKASVASKVKYDPFNSMLLTANKSKKIFGDITASYLAASTKNAKLKKAFANAGSSVIKSLNKEIQNAAKKTNKGQVTAKFIENYTKTIQERWKVALDRMPKLISGANKKTKKALQSYGAVLASWATNMKTASQYVPNVVKNLEAEYSEISDVGTSKITEIVSNVGSMLVELGKTGTVKSLNLEGTIQGMHLIDTLTELQSYYDQIKDLQKKAKQKPNAETVMNSFADMLYKQSDEYKTDMKTLDTDYKNIENSKKKIDKLKKKLKKANAKDRKSIRKDITKEQKQLKKYEEQFAKDAGKMAAKPAKYLKEFRNGIRDTVKEVAKLSNIKLAENIFSGFNWESVEKNFDAFTTATSQALGDSAYQSIQTLDEAFDVLSAKMETGLNLLEKFTKTGTAEPAALLENATTQLDAYEELLTGLDELQKKGFDQSLIDQLEEQGIQSLNYVRGFLEMSDDDISEYNKKLEKKAEYEQKTLERSLKKQADQYNDWMKDINDLIAKGVGEDFIKKLKAAGVTQANFVKALKSMSTDSLKDVESYYLKATDKTLVNFTKELSKSTSSAGTEAGEKYVDSFRQALEITNKEESEWEEKLKQLSDMGYSETVVKKFREMGRESGLQWVETCLKETADGIKYINEQIGSNSFEIGIENVESENADYKSYLKNIETVNNKIAELEAQAKAATDKITQNSLLEQSVAYKAVLKEMQDLGYSEAEAVRMLAEANTEEVVRMYNALNERKRINKSATWDSLKLGQKDKKQLQQDYADAFKWVEENVFVKGDGAGYNNDNNKKAQTELMAQIKSMGMEEAVQYVEALKSGYETDRSGFISWQKDFFVSTFKLPESVADRVASSYANVATGNASAYSKAYMEQLNADAEHLSNEFANVIRNAFANSKVEQTATNSMNNSLKGLSKAIKNQSTSAKKSANTVGTAVATGMRNGITENESKITKAAKQAAKGALEAAAKTLGIKSPSTEFIKLGKFTDLGYAKGIIDNSNIAENATADMANNIAATMLEAVTAINSAVNDGFVLDPTLDTESTQAKLNEEFAKLDIQQQMFDTMAWMSQAMSDSLTIDPSIEIDEDKTRAIETMRAAIESVMAVANEDIDTNPVIVPEIDITEARKTAQELNQMLADNDAKLSAGVVDSEIQNGAGNGMTFVQNNYSPKALDRLEIYRQTNNAFARMKGMVNAR